jgi:hypothetical protein
MSCVKPNGYVARAGDCNDQEATINPAATEIIDGKDNDCDGLVDEGFNCETIWYIDYDGDTYGRASRTKMSCVQPNGYVARAGDCNDQDLTIYPGADELCDGKDNDCDGLKDEGCDLITSVQGTKPAAKADVVAASEKLEARIWPNPARTELMVSLDKFLPNQKVEMVLMTSEGRSVKAESLIPSIKGQQVRFDVRNFASGYYLLQVKQGALSETKRVMIIR